MQNSSIMSSKENHNLMSLPFDNWSINQNHDIKLFSFNSKNQNCSKIIDRKPDQQSINLKHSQERNDKNHESILNTVGNNKSRAGNALSNVLHIIDGSKLKGRHCKKISKMNISNNSDSDLITYSLSQEYLSSKCESKSNYDLLNDITNVANPIGFYNPSKKHSENNINPCEVSNEYIEGFRNRSKNFLTNKEIILSETHIDSEKTNISQPSMGQNLMFDQKIGPSTTRSSHEKFNSKLQEYSRYHEHGNQSFNILEVKQDCDGCNFNDQDIEQNLTQNKFVTRGNLESRARIMESSTIDHSIHSRPTKILKYENDKTPGNNTENNRESLVCSKKFNDLSFMVEYEKRRVAKLKEKLNVKKNLLNNMTNFNKDMIQYCEEAQNSLQRAKEEKEITMKKLKAKIKTYKERYLIAQEEKVVALEEVENMKGLIRKKDDQINILNEKVMQLKKSFSRERSDKIKHQEELAGRLEQTLEENTKLLLVNHQLSDNVQELNMQISLQSKRYNKEIEYLRYEINKVNEKIVYLGSTNNLKTLGNHGGNKFMKQTLGIENEIPEKDRAESIQRDEIDLRNEDFSSQIKLLKKHKKQSKAFMERLRNIIADNAEDILKIDQNNFEDILEKLSIVFEENKVLKKNIFQRNIDNEHFLKEIMFILNIDDPADIIQRIKDLITSKSPKRMPKKLNIHIDTSENSTAYATTREGYSVLGSSKIYL